MIILNNEKIIEEELIKNLENLNYEKIHVKNYSELKDNLKKCLENFNDINLTDDEFERIYLELNRGTNFERASRLRNNSFKLNRDNKRFIINYFDMKNWSKNKFQVINQFKMTNEGKNNRYDVTILINGFPMVQIELKRRGGDLSRAFNQINRYKRDTYIDLFKFIQLFIISNGDETKYFSTNDDFEKNNPKFSFKWMNFDNQHINSLLTSENGKKSFVESFLTREMLWKMIARYMILQKGQKQIKILRPYQFHAVEAILEKVNNSDNGGFIWHTTGSGKTLTSFKAAQEILNNSKKVEKIFFVVDRIDLNSQTFSEFKNFDVDESVSNTENTKELIDKIKNDQREIVVTTLQKFKRAISEIEDNSNNCQDKRIVIIYDECHRSLFGETSKLIKGFFNNCQMFGFTGTPIKEKNSINGITTYDLFDKTLLHEYKISEAIADGNVLGFSIEYFGDNNIEQVPNDKRKIDEVVRKIFEIHNKKTINREYNAMLATSSIKTLIEYYDSFNEINKTKTNDEKLKVAAIFSINDNDDVVDGDLPNKDKLLSIIEDYYSLRGLTFPKGMNYFNIYRSNLIESIRKKEIDIVLVVNMFTTGFDSPTLNTLYIDKKIDYHGLIQTFSRTNRIHNHNKRYGNIISFFNPTKQKVDESISEYATNSNLNSVIIPDYSETLESVNFLYNQIKLKFDNPDNILSSHDEKLKFAFVKDFKKLLYEFNLLKTFIDYDKRDLKFDINEFEGFVSGYRSIWNENKKNQDEDSILNEIDFNMELLTKDRIDSSYIRELLSRINVTTGEEVTASEYNERLFELENILERLTHFPQSLIDSIREFIFFAIENKKIDSSKKLYFEDLLEYLSNLRMEKLEKICKDFNFDKESYLNLIKDYEETTEFKDELISDLFKEEIMYDNIFEKFILEKLENVKINEELHNFQKRSFVFEEVMNKIRDAYESTKLF